MVNPLALYHSIYHSDHVVATMDKLAEIVDIQASLDETTNDLLALPLNDLSGLTLCLFEEARSCSLADPNDVLVNRKGSALHPRSFTIVNGILTLAASIQDRKTIPRTLVRNGKRSIQDLSTWRSSEKCHKEVETVSGDAQTYSLRSTSSSLPPPDNEN